MITTKLIRAALILFVFVTHIAACAVDVKRTALPADSGNIRVTLLGTGTPVPNPRQMGQSILVEAGDTSLLFDCGRGCGHRLWNLAPKYLRDTNHVFLTHLHSDHTMGMSDFYINGWVRGRSMPVEVVGPRGTDELMRHLRLAYDQDVVIRVDRQKSGLTRDPLEYSIKEAHDGAKYTIGGVTVTAFLVDHHVVKPAFGYRIDYAGRSVVISGDTAYSTNLIKYSQNVDVLIHEVMSPHLEIFLRDHYEQEVADDIIALHTLAPDVGRVFSETKTRLGVYTHLDNNPKSIPELIKQTRTTWKGALEVGEDLMVIEIGDTISVRRPD